MAPKDIVVAGVTIKDRDGKVFCQGEAQGVTAANLPDRCLGFVIKTPGSYLIEGLDKAEQEQLTVLREILLAFEFRPEQINEVFSRYYRTFEESGQTEYPLGCGW